MSDLGVIAVPQGTNLPGPVINLPTLPTAPAPQEPAVIDVGPARVATPNLDATMQRLRQQQTQPVVAQPVVQQAQPQSTTATPNQTQQTQDPYLEWASRERAATAAGGVPALSDPYLAYSPKAGQAQQQPTMQQQPWYQGFTDYVKGIGETVHGLGANVAHGLTGGLDEIVAPVPAAAAVSLIQGIPFSQAYDQVVQNARNEREQYARANPISATTGEVVGAVASPLNQLAAPLFAKPVANPTTMQSVINYGRNLAANTAVGGIAGGLMQSGGVDERLQGAKEGAGFGAVLGGAAPVVNAIANRVSTALRPSSAVDRIAGQALLERAGGSAPAMEAAPLPGMQPDIGMASNNAGLAAQARQTAQIEPVLANKSRVANNEAVRRAATTMQPGRVQLAVAPSAAEGSVAAVEGMQKAYDVLQTEARRLWSAPALTSVQPNVQHVKDAVERAISALPPRFQNAVEGSRDLQAALNDLRNMPATASLADLNQVRSDILATSRTLPFDQRFAKRVADDVAKAVLDGIETDPAIAQNAAAQAAYKQARDYTRRMWTVLEKPQFMRMLQASEDNRKGIDPATVAARAFNFSVGSEKAPQGVKKITDLLDDVRRQWGALQTGNAGTVVGGFDPAVAFDAKVQLKQGLRDVIVHSMLDTATSRARDISGAQGYLPNAISEWIDTNRSWLTKSDIMTTSQLGLLDKIHKAAVMMGRPQNLSGGPGSQTYELFSGDRYINAFLGPLLGRALPTAAGAAAGAIATKLFGENAIGGMISMELIGLGGLGGGVFGPAILRRMYDAPRDQIMKRIAEAVYNPQIAADLMKRAGEPVGAATRQWLQSMVTLGTVAAGATQPGSVEVEPPANPANQ